MKKITILLAITLLVMGGCKKKDAVVTAGGQKMTIRTQEVHTEDVDQTYEYTAIVEANAVNNIAPLTGGRIDKIYVEVGDRVAKGKVLVQMDENSLKQSKSQLDNLKTSFQRIDELYKVGGCSKSDWDAMKAGKHAVGEPDFRCGDAAQLRQRRPLRRSAGGAGAADHPREDEHQHFRDPVQAGEGRHAGEHQGGCLRRRGVQGSYQPDLPDDGRRHAHLPRGGAVGQHRQPRAPGHVRPRDPQLRHPEACGGARRGHLPSARLRQPLRLCL